MATKTISITEEAYRRLASQRQRENESFSEVIVRVTGRHRLKELHGILSKEAGDELEKSISEGRALHRKMHKERTKKLLEELNNGMS